MNEGGVDRRLLSRILAEALLPEEWTVFSAGDWEQIVRLAQAEGVAPLLHWSLSRSGRINLLPPAEKEHLRAIYVTARMNNNQLLRELQRLNRLFERAEIPVVALKGICFALTIYPEIGLRPMADLDLLLPASQVASALHIVRSCGYADAVPEAIPGLDELLSRPACLRKTELPLTTLEVHHTLAAEDTSAHTVSVDWFWSQTEFMEAYTPGRKLGRLRMLSPTAQLLYACAHAMQHGGRKASLRWLYDIDLLVRVHAARLDWELLLAQARSFEWDSAAYTVLDQARSCFETPIPQAVLDALANGPDQDSGGGSEMQTPPGTHTLEEYRKLKSLDLPGKLKSILGLVVPGPAYMRWRYGVKHSWTLPVWYLYRWWGIVLDGVGTLVYLAQRGMAPADHPAKSEP